MRSIRSLEASRLFWVALPAVVLTVFSLRMGGVIQ